MNARWLSECVVVALLALSAALLQAQKADPWLTRTNPGAYDAQRGPDAPLKIDMPKKDWMILPASRSVLFLMASRKGDAVVTVERAPLSLALAPEDVTDVLAQIQADTIKEREPRASEFEARVIDAGERRFVAVQYRRPGALGAERVRQYSVPVGHWLYHVTCAASLAQFASYEAIFAHVAGSFSATE